MHHVSTLIVGAGIAGASLACSLAERGRGRGVVIADLDVFGRYSSSELNGGGVRCTFAQPINIKLSLVSLRYYMEHAAKFDWRQRGYLWMYDEALWAQSRQFLPLVRSFGLPVEELTPAQLKDRFPILSDVSDLAGATLTPMDGRLSPHRLRIHYLDHAQAGGVELLDRFQVVGIEGQSSPYRVTLRRVGPRSVKRALTDGVAAARPSGGEQQTLTIQVDRLINAAGPWAGEIARLYGRELPITPLPRQVFLLWHREVNLEPLPFFLDYPQDIYFRHYDYDRRRMTLVSWSDPNERPGHSFAHHGQGYYEQHVKPRLTKRIATLGDATLAGGWVGHYELTPDKGAIIGPVPDRPGLFNYNGLSAHGIMQSRALAEALATYLTTGRWPDELNLEDLTESRFAPGRQVVEPMYV